MPIVPAGYTSVISIFSINSFNQRNQKYLCMCDALDANIGDHNTSGRNQK